MLPLLNSESHFMPTATLYLLIGRRVLSISQERPPESTSRFGSSYLAAATSSGRTDHSCMSERNGDYDQSIDPTSGSIASVARERPDAERMLCQILCGNGIEIRGTAFPAPLDRSARFPVLH
jgi:hypothetical protein